MIKLKRLNGTDFYLNPELIEQIESAPDTVITTTTGNNFIVKESVSTVIERITEYRRSVQAAKKNRPLSSVELQKVK